MATERKVWEIIKNAGFFHFVKIWQRFTFAGKSGADTKPINSWGSHSLSAYLFGILRKAHNESEIKNTKV